jgi:hypothetical protein
MQANTGSLNINVKYFHSISFWDVVGDIQIFLKSTIFFKNRILYIFIDKCQVTFI